MLIVAAIGVVLITVAAGFLLYENTQALTVSAKWVQHTQEVLSSLQRATLLTERTESRSRLFLLTGEGEQLNRARTSVNLLVNTAQHLRQLVADNDSQTKNVQQLSTCAEDLTQILSSFNSRSALPETLIQRCQQTIGLMTDQEQLLLTERSQGSQRSFVTSVGTEIAFIGVAVLTMVVLFGFLMRDAVHRQRIGKLTERTNERLAGTIKALEDQARVSALLTASRDELQLCVEVQQVYDSAAKSLSQLLPGTSGCLAIINNSRKIVQVGSSWGQTAFEDFTSLESCCGLRSGQPRWRLPGRSEIHCDHFTVKAPDRYCCKPIVAHGNTLGILYIECPSGEIANQVEHLMDGVRHLVQITGIAVATLNLQAKLESQSIRDSLTGLFNRRFLEVSLEREILRAARRKQLLTVLMLDVDYFKRFNDSFGHTAGDAALKAIGGIFRNSIRADDIACRYGGEEFTIILPDVTAEIACDRAEAVREAVANLQVTVGKEVFSDFTISIGVAFYPSDGESAELLLHKADLALYRAKKDGRNRVSIFDTTMQEV